MLNKTHTHRLAIAMVICWIGLGVGSRARASSIALQTPAGLSPGESFRFIFVTDGSTTGTSSNIADYNNFVNAQAGGATYNGSVVSWLAIASTSTVNAIDNVGRLSDPVYLSNGTQVFSNTLVGPPSQGGVPGSMWVSDNTPQALPVGITLDLAGHAPYQPFGLVWTGTDTGGTQRRSRIPSTLQVSHVRIIT